MILIYEESKNSPAISCLLCTLKCALDASFMAEFEALSFTILIPAINEVKHEYT